jgi:hypothetical protein
VTALAAWWLIAVGAGCVVVIGTQAPTGSSRSRMMLVTVRVGWWIRAAVPLLASLMCPSTAPSAGPSWRACGLGFLVAWAVWLLIDRLTLCSTAESWRQRLERLPDVAPAGKHPSVSWHPALLRATPSLRRLETSCWCPGYGWWPGGEDVPRAAGAEPDSRRSA